MICFCTHLSYSNALLVRVELSPRSGRSGSTDGSGIVANLYQEVEHVTTKRFSVQSGDTEGSARVSLSSASGQSVGSPSTMSAYSRAGSAASRPSRPGSAASRPSRPGSAASRPSRPGSAASRPSRPGSASSVRIMGDTDGAESGYDGDGDFRQGMMYTHENYREDEDFSGAPRDAVLVDGALAPEGELSEEELDADDSVELPGNGNLRKEVVNGFSRPYTAARSRSQSSNLQKTRALRKEVVNGWKRPWTAARSRTQSNNLRLARATKASPLGLKLTEPARIRGPNQYQSVRAI